MEQNIIICQNKRKQFISSASCRTICIGIFFAIIIQLVSSKNNDLYLCHVVSRLQGRANRDSHALLAIGDIHGAYDGLLEVLYHFGAIRDRHFCEWNTKGTPVRIVQMGDIVDRGKNSTEVVQCLRNLQATATETHQLYRLIGNHDLMWMDGRGNSPYRNKVSDTQPVVDMVAGMMKEDILNDRLLGSLYLEHHSIPILFSHAGYRRGFLHYLRDQLSKSSESIVSKNFPQQVATFVHNQVKSAIEKCTRENTLCRFYGQVFDAGPDRGGGGIGGPYWTDYSVMTNESDSGLRRPFTFTSSMESLDLNLRKAENLEPYDFIQVVGHTPKKSTVRTTSDLSVINVDVGMFFGGRGYMFISMDGNINTLEKQNDGKWNKKHITNMFCGN